MMTKKKISKTVYEDYCNLYDLFKSRETPFADEGFRDETQIKIKYDSDKEQILIVWQDSRSKFDWIHTDLFFIPRIHYCKCKKDTPDCPTEIMLKHSGFDRAYDSIRSYVKRELDKIIANNPKCKRIIQYGHSLGAALATQSHFMISQNYPDMILRTIITGSPRVFINPILVPWTIVRWFKLRKHTTNIYSFRNKYDLIPKLPFVIIGYVHLVKGIKIGHTKFKDMFNPKECPHIIEKYKISLDEYFKDHN